MTPEYGPVMICKTCVKKVKKFYKFKQNCLKADQELRNIPKIYVEDDLPNKNFTGQFKNEFTENVSNNSDSISYYEEKNRETGEYFFKSELFIGDRVPNTNKRYERKYKKKEINSRTTQCELCGLVMNAKDFRKHLSSHGELKLFQCKFCPKQFTRSETNVIHMRSHMGIKPFICEICGQLSTKRQDLIRHMKIHSNEKEYKCLACGRQFKRSSDLSSHKRTHTGARPYKCRLCDKDYTSHSGLRKHYKTYCKKEHEHSF